MLRLGIPRTLDYKGLRKEPFWQLKERLALRLLERETNQKILHAILLQKTGLQGFPGQNLNSELVKDLARDARRSCREYARSVAPWLQDMALQTEEDKKQELLGDSAGLIEAWIAHFEPDNLAQHQAEMRAAMERVDAEQ